jgi:hypothetical protein
MRVRPSEGTPAFTDQVNPHAAGPTVDCSVAVIPDHQQRPQGNDHADGETTLIERIAHQGRQISEIGARSRLPRSNPTPPPAVGVKK